MREEFYRFVPLSELLNPPAGGIEHIKNAYWCVHPEKGLAFYTGGCRSGFGNPYGAPQCNIDERITRKCKPSWAEVRFIPSVYLRRIASDYY